MVGEVGVEAGDAGRRLGGAAGVRGVEGVGGVGGVGDVGDVVVVVVVVGAGSLAPRRTWMRRWTRISSSLGMRSWLLRS